MWGILEYQLTCAKIVTKFQKINGRMITCNNCKLRFPVELTSTTKEPTN